MTDANNTAPSSIDTKSALQSVTLWSLFVLVVTYVMQRYHIFTGDATQAAQLIDQGYDALQKLGVIGILWGRLRIGDLKVPSVNLNITKLAVICTFIVGMGLVGCSTTAPATLTNQDRALIDSNNAKLTYILAVQTIDALHASGQISDSKYAEITTTRKIVTAYLTALQAAADANSAVDPSVKAAGQKALDDLVQASK